jgi:acetylornithine deacetylase/succinyl-diaminopimelate desuccinylase-like protein
VSQPSPAQAYIESHRAEFLEELLTLLRIPTVSSDPAAAKDIARCAAWVRDRMVDAGLKAEVLPTGGLPVVYGERLNGNLPTVLIYGHYDVQPPDPLEKWRHPPFEPTMEGDSVVARGASDDKGQVYALLCGVEAALKTGGARGVNVKVLIEGEEEVGSPSLAPFIRKEKRRLKTDAVVIADTSQFARGVPAITYGLKGIVYLEAVVRGPSKDLHSGSYGGSVMNPANALTRIIAACQGPFGKVAIPGFYDKVVPLADWERAEFKKLPFKEEEFLKEVGAVSLHGEEGYTTLERKWARPTFDVNGLVSGHTGPGSKTVLPSEARAKFSMRIVPDQDPVEIAALTEKFIREIAPPGVTVEILSYHNAYPVLIPRESPVMKAARPAMARGFGREPVLMREGGSIPVVTTFKHELGADSALVGLGLPDDNLHSPNEKFCIPDFYRGMIVMAEFLEEFGKK